MKRTIPELWVEQYALGELSPERRAQVEEALGDTLQARVDAIRRTDAEMLKALPPRVFASRVQVSRPSPVRWKLWVPVLAAAVGLLVVAPTVLQGTGTTTEITRAKGDAMLQVHRQVGQRTEALRDGDAAVAGDVLQVAYTAGGAEFGAIGSVDGNGVLTWHLPLHGSHAVKLQGGAGVPLAESYELDDAPDRERFFFVTSPGDFPLDDVEAAVKDWAGGELELVPPLSTTVFTVEKGGIP